MCFRRLDVLIVRLSRSYILVIIRISYRGVFSVMVIGRLISRRIWVLDLGSFNSVFDVVSFVIYFIIVELEIKNVFIVIDIIIYGNVVEY